MKLGVYSMSKIKLRLKNKVQAGFIGGLIVFIITGSGFVFFINYNAERMKAIRSEYENQLGLSQQQLTEQQAMSSKVVVTTAALKAGDFITKNDIKLEYVSKNGAPANAVTDASKLIGKIVKIDVTESTPLISSMVYSNGRTPADERSKEYDVIQLPSKIKKNEFVDVRIGFPNGSDYIVLSKKKVEDLAGSKVWYKINESEILAMSSAIVDAYLQGAKLYAISYSDPYMQEKAIPNYPANIDVINLINSDPNVYEKAALQLSKAARETLNANLAKMSDADKAKYGATTTDTSTEVDVTNTPSTVEEPTTSNSESSLSQPAAIPSTDQNAVPANVDESSIVTPKDSPAADTTKEKDVFEQELVK